MVVSCLLTARFGGKTRAQVLTALAFLLTAFLRTHILFQPNILDNFCWTTCIWLLVAHQQEKKPAWFYAFVAVSVLGFYGKYTQLFLLAAIGTSWILSNRSYLTSRLTWRCLAIAALLLLPNIWWQYQHRFPLAHHMQELRDTQLQYLSKADFLKDQLLMLLPVLPLWLAGLFALLKEKTYRWIGITYIAVVILLMLGSGKSYYALGIYPPLVAAGAARWESFGRNRLWARLALPAWIVLLGLPMVPLLTPLWSPGRLAAYFEKSGIRRSGFLKWEDQKDHPLPQDYADMLGWKELAVKTEAAYHRLPPADQANTYVFCDNYGQAGALLYYAQDTVYKKKIFSANGSFLLWIPPVTSFKHFLVTNEEIPPRDHPFFGHFKELQVLDSVQQPYARQQGDKVMLFRGADSQAYAIANALLKQERDEFRR